MLFLSIFTFNAANREAIIEKRILGGKKIPKGIQVLQEVVDLQNNRVFRISEVTDPKAVLASNLAWGDVGEIETIPVMETEEMLDTLYQMNEKEHHRPRPSRPPQFYSQPEG